MQVLVTFRHMDATVALRQYAESKVARVHKYLRHPIEAHVVLEVNKRRHVAEITLTGEHLKANAKEETDDLYSAIDLAMSKIERQVQKHITKREKRKHAVLPPVAAPAVPRRRARPAVVTERIAAELMSVADAVRRLGRKSEDVVLFVFLNEASDALNVLYRRKDGSYGLIVPEVG